ncbi:phosphonatase-like hydrolase [Mycolicibacterium phlei]|uniref:phosphonatase-like hydrolase n=1 Tax=Mycolicibacterium phlei TaxID=1771 RepID=UPI00025AE76A|nr:phosphonatase-like hydrolase [Mycolicibacterium phlei]EID09228.1 HAD family hydrolase [Mycolicibacterium phlei RIVM601174]
MQIELAVLDMAGTVVRDDGLVVRAFEEAATAVGVPADGPERDAARRYVLDTMGQSKIAVFTHLFGEVRAEEANIAFEKTYERFIETGASPIPGAAETISALRGAGVRVALTTGFSPSTQQRILDALGWDDIADVVLAPGPGVRGRPYPDLVLTALMRTGVDDVRKVAVVGDTVSDIAAGLRAGSSVVAGVLTGAHDTATLKAAGATHIIGSVAELPAIVLTD